MGMMSDGGGHGEDDHRSRVGVTVTAVTADVEMPPPFTGHAILRPMLVLPEGVRVCVDQRAPDEEAAQWFRELAVASMYAAMWHENRAGFGAAGSERFRR